jgi:GT2 family glycosyltransferase
MQLPLISVIVLNYNGQKHLEDCFSSLLALEYERFELLLVDNASTDDSVAWMREHFPSVGIVQNEQNLGFANGNNCGAEAAAGEYIAFLNNDMRVDARWLSELIGPCLEGRNILCTAAKILNWDGTAIDFAGAAMNFMGWGSQIDFGSRHVKGSHNRQEVLFACGGSMLIQREVFLSAGGFDGDYFAYFEDVDLGWRLQLFGHKIMFVPAAICYHRHHGSWGEVSDAKKWVLNERNTLSGLIKNYDDIKLSRVLPAAILLLTERAFLDIKPALIAHGIALFDFPSGDAFGLSFYIKQTRDLIGKREFRQLTTRSVHELGRRWKRVRQATYRPWPLLPRSARGNHKLKPASKLKSAQGELAASLDGWVEVPALMLSRMVAARDILHLFPVLQAKRQVIQSKRCRTDAQVARLFKIAFDSNFSDVEFSLAMRFLIGRLGLVDVFKEERIFPDESIVAESQDMCLALLRVLDYALALSQVPVEHFRLGGAPVQKLYRVPMKCVDVLVRYHALIHSIPEASVSEIFTYLKQGCQQILPTEAARL